MRACAQSWSWEQLKNNVLCRIQRQQWEDVLVISNVDGLERISKYPSSPTTLFEWNQHHKPCLSLPPKSPFSSETLTIWEFPLKHVFIYKVEEYSFLTTLSTSQANIHGTKSWTTASFLQEFRVLPMLGNSLRRRPFSSPKNYWCASTCLQRLLSITPKRIVRLFQLEGQNQYMGTLGETGDISNLCQFGWYEWVYFCQNTVSSPYQKEELGRCLGPTKNEGNEMCQWILQKMAR